MSCAGGSTASIARGSSCRFGGKSGSRGYRQMARSDVVFTFSVEMLDDAVQRQFCRPPDQMLALAGDDQVGRLLVADSWRSVPVSLLRRRPVQPMEQITIAGRAATRLRPY